MNITKNTMRLMREAVDKHIDRCLFVSYDIEMTGLTSNKLLFNSNMNSVHH